MMWLLDVLSSAGFGSIVGGVFGYLSKREERENLKLKYDHEVLLLKAKTQAAVETAKLSLEQSKVVGALAVEQIEAKAFQDSQKQASSWSESLKSCIRPIILGLLFYQTWLILCNLEAMTGGLSSLPETEVIALYKTVVLAITGLTATAVGWYFAARSSKQFDRLVEKWNG